MGNYIFTIIRLCACLGLIAGLQGQVTAFKMGEVLTYTASFNYIPAGTAELSVIGVEQIYGQDAFHVQYHARSGTVVDKLFRIRDKIDTWVDIDNLYTYRQVKDMSEGNYRHKSDTWMNYTDSIAISGQDTARLSGPVRDPYSLFYYLRTIDLPMDSVFTFTTYENKKLTSFQMKVGASETLEVPAGEFNCFHVRPYQKTKNLLKNKGELDLWFSTDKNRYPIQIILKLKYGTLKLKLQSINS